MENKIFILIAIFSLSLSGCNNWLDVRPETEVDLEDMYADQQGFQDALTGAYLDLKNDNAYGKDLTYNIIEYLAQHWDCASESTEEELSRYNYTHTAVQDAFENIYSQLYAAIASVNMILEQIDGKQEVFEQGMYEIIKGEALAIRAFCHFDLLRLFGPMPTQVSGVRILPYVTSVSLAYHEHHTYEVYTQLLENDLLLADSLLSTADPIIFTIAQEREELSIAAENFLVKRQIRFNYYAVKALEARFYLWLGGDENKAKAYTCAQEVIGALDEDGQPLFSLGSSSDIGSQNYVFTSEHILAIYDYQLADKAEDMFTMESPFSKERDIVVPDLYAAGTTDIRFQIWQEYTAENGAKSFTIKKYHQDKTVDEGDINQIPLIRLAEMYFIAMECGTLAEADALYETFCLSRDIPLLEIRSENQLKDILLDEYNKEFYGEGQAFYAFKRLAVENILWAQDPGNAETYVVPLPLNEVNYNN